jgi:hypothetical protein
MHYFNLNPNLSWVHSLLIASLMLSGSVAMAAPSGLLNDTGQTGCYDHNDALVTCSLTTTDAAGVNARPRQDGRFGRDVASFTKVGAGAAGFDFTPLDANGNAISFSGSPAVPSATHRCVKDNVTNLIWEVKTNSGLQDTNYTYGWGSNNFGTSTCGSGAASLCDTDTYITELNDANICGETSNDWRLPSRRELLSIVHRGLATDPVVDANFFPRTQSNAYWTSDNGVPSGGFAWSVNFVNGDTGAQDKSTFNHVRLVRSGP